MLSPPVSSTLHCGSAWPLTNSGVSILSRSTPMEEGIDQYTRTNNLQEAVVDAVTPSIFYSALWECVATNATIRLPALTFWVAGMDEQLYLLGTDIDIETMLATLLRGDMSLSRRLFQLAAGV